MNSDLAQALHVQSLDLRIAELRQEIATLPKQLAEIERLLESHAKRLEFEKTRLSANQKDRKKFEVEIEQHGVKAAKLKEQMMLAKTNEQLWAFQKEIGFHESEISRNEDQILELMMEAEKIEATVKESEKALAAEKKVVDAKKAETTQRTNADKEELAKVEAERKTSAASIPAELLRSYDRLHARMSDGVAIAEAAGGVCLGCQMTLRPQLFYDVRQGDRILACESCKRLLYVADAPRDVASEMNA